MSAVILPSAGCRLDETIKRGPCEASRRLGLLRMRTVVNESQEGESGTDVGGVRLAEQHDMVFL